MSVRRALTSTRREYTVSYQGFRGVDLSSDTNSSGRLRLTRLQNMYRDYSSGGEVIESIPGFRKILSTSLNINGMFLQRTETGEEYILLHARDRLYRFATEDRDSIGGLSSLITMNDAPSAAYTSGSDIYILDGEKITRVDALGQASYVMNGSASAPYIPTTYRDGKEYEQRNLLTDLSYEERFIAFPEDIAYETEGIIYRITDPEERVCAVVGISPEFTGALYIPSYASLGGERYTVAEIAPSAFAHHTGIRKLTVAEGIKRIGEKAFYSCTLLTVAIIPDSVTEIGNEAFSLSSSLAACRLGASLKRLGTAPFRGCDSLSEINYALSAESLSLIEGYTPALFPDGITINEYSAAPSLRLNIKLSAPALNIVDVSINGTSVSYVTVRSGDDAVGVTLSNIRRENITAATVRIKLYNRERQDRTSDIGGASFITRLKDGERGFDVISRCTVAECFDGRIFLSGDPAHPGAVFYSSYNLSGTNDPLYFGVYNYFIDGVGSYPVVSLLSASDSLAVFKGGDDGTGSIFYHKPRETGIDLLPRIYPVSYVHSGVATTGKTVSFFDDPLFLSHIGVMALDKRQINLERSIVCRSSNVNASLLSERLSDAAVAKWCGYLVITVGGRGYLADSRAVFTGPLGMEYEWFTLSGLGTYEGDTSVFRYSPTAHEGLSVHRSPDAKVQTIVYSTDIGSETVYYTEEGGESYEVYRTEERTGGVFSPATHLLSTEGELLFFATKSGDVCVFNNDRRGIAPPSVSESPDYDAESYRAVWGDKIHPAFYSFDRHAAHYELATVYDDGGVPYFTKSSVKASLTLKLECMGAERIECRVDTDSGEYSEEIWLSPPEFDFSAIDFSAFSFESEGRTSIPVRERLRSWVEKRVTLTGDGYCAPFGIRAISYRFTVKGRIKRQTR